MENYESLEMEIIRFDTEDMMIVSGNVSGSEMADTINA